MDTAYARHIWRLALVMAALTVAGFILTGLRLDPFSQPLLAPAFGLLGAIWWFYRKVRPDPRVRTLAECLVQMMLLLLFGTLLSYAAMAAAFPLQDANLLAIDKAFGIDRNVYIDAIGSWHWLHNALVLAYFTLMPQFVAIPLVLFFANQSQRLQQFTLATGIALLATVAISVVTPAYSAVWLDLGLADFAALPPFKGVHVPVLEDLRAGALNLIALDQLEGIITFPSFHTIGALLFIWATWPLRFARWVSLVLNTGLIAATPIVGTHYFIDIVASFVVAGAAVAAVLWIGRPAGMPCAASNDVQIPAGSIARAEQPSPLAATRCPSPASDSTDPARSGPC